MPTLTTNYSLEKPLVNDPTDEDLWGDELNDDLDDIDSLLKQGITVTTQSSQTAGFTATTSISVKYLYPCDATALGFTATIPTALSAGNGAMVFIKKTDATTNVITIARSSSDTLDGATSLSLPSQNDTYGLVSDGVSKWSSVCKPSQAVPDATESVKGIVELATNAEALAGSDTTRAVTSSGLASSKSYTSDGYQKLPGGLIFQWGSTQAASISFPTAFSTACLQVITSYQNPSTNAISPQFWNVTSKSTTGFTVTTAATPFTLLWFAVGY